MELGTLGLRIILDQVLTDLIVVNFWIILNDLTQKSKTFLVYRNWNPTGKSLQHLAYEISHFSKAFLSEAYEISDFFKGFLEISYGYPSVASVSIDVWCLKYYRTDWCFCFYRSILCDDKTGIDKIILTQADIVGASW